MREPAVAWLRGRVEVEVEQQHQAQAWESLMTLCDKQALCQDGDGDGREPRARRVHRKLIRGRRC